MRKDLVVGIKSGVISSIPFVAYMAATSLPNSWATFSSVPVQVSSLVRMWVFVILSLLTFLTYLVVFGVVAGFIFVFILNRLPFRSTYTKTIFPSVILWTIQATYNLFFLTSIIHYLSLILPNLLIFVLDAVIFSYLFDRWMHQYTNMPPFSPMKTSRKVLLIVIAIVILFSGFFIRLLFLLLNLIPK